MMNDGEVKVWRRPDKKNKALIVMKASIEVEGVEPEDIMGVWRDIDYRFSWDDRCVKNTCHTVMGDDPKTQNEIGYYEGMVRSLCLCSMAQPRVSRFCSTSS